MAPAWGMQVGQSSCLAAATRFQQRTRLTDAACAPHPHAAEDAGGAPPAPRATAEGLDASDPCQQGERTALREDEVSVRRETSTYDV